MENQQAPRYPKWLGDPRPKTFWKTCQKAVGCDCDWMASYKSYISGLKHTQNFPHCDRVYVCLPEPNNPFDANALVVCDEKQQKIGYVPRDLSSYLMKRFPDLQSGLAVLICYCKGPVTQRSAQCVYNCFLKVPPIHSQV